MQPRRSTQLKKNHDESTLQRQAYIIQTAFPAKHTPPSRTATWPKPPLRFASYVRCRVYAAASSRVLSEAVEPPHDESCGYASRLNPPCQRWWLRRASPNWITRTTHIHQKIVPTSMQRDLPLHRHALAPKRSTPQARGMCYGATLWEGLLSFLPTPYADPVDCTSNTL